MTNEKLNKHIKLFRDNLTIILYCNKDVYKVLKQVLTKEELTRVRYER